MFRSEGQTIVSQGWMKNVTLKWLLEKKLASFNNYNSFVEKIVNIIDFHFGSLLVSGMSLYLY